MATSLVSAIWLSLGHGCQQRGSGKRTRRRGQRGSRRLQHSLLPPTLRAFFQLRHSEQPTLTHLKVLNLATICCYEKGNKIVQTHASCSKSVAKWTNFQSQTISNQEAASLRTDVDNILLDHVRDLDPQLYYLVLPSS